MSADNWTICPRCKKERKELAEKHRKNFEEGYGKLSREEFIATMKAINLISSKLKNSDDHDVEKIENTLREHYEMFTDKDGYFFVSYSCYCEVCSFSYRFKHEEYLFEEKE